MPIFLPSCLLTYLVVSSIFVFAFLRVVVRGAQNAAIGKGFVCLPRQEREGKGRGRQRRERNIQGRSWFREEFFGKLFSSTRQRERFSFFWLLGVELRGFFSFAMATVVGTMAMAGSLMRLPQPSLAVSSTRASFPGRLCLCSFRSTGRLQLQSSSSWQRRPLFVSQKSAQSEARVFFVLFLLIFVPSCFDKNPED